MDAIVVARDREGHPGGKLPSLWGVSFCDSAAFDAAGREVLGFAPSTGFDLDMRILITGDQHWRCDDLAEQILNRLLARSNLPTRRYEPIRDDSFGSIVPQ